MARTTPLSRFAILALLLETIAKLNSIPVIAAVRVLNASGLHALADLLSRPTHPPLTPLRLLLLLMEEAEEVARALIAVRAVGEASVEVRAALGPRVHARNTSVYGVFVFHQKDQSIKFVPYAYKSNTYQRLIDDLS